MDVKKVANLARLKLSAKEEAAFETQLADIIKHFEEISEINTDNIEPMVTPSHLDAFWREDVVKETLTTEEALANAPEKNGNLFKVPPVVS